MDWPGPSRTALARASRSAWGDSANPASAFALLEALVSWMAVIAQIPSRRLRSCRGGARVCNRTCAAIENKNGCLIGSRIHMSDCALSLV